MAECHPVAFRWPMKAKVERGAKIIHVDPRFTRTSAMADIYAPVRAGTDIAFLGGLVNYVLNSEKWNSDPFFREYVVNYTNAATIISEEFRDTEDLDGVFSGLMQYTGNPKDWPFDGFVGQYDPASWQYARRGAGGAPNPNAASFDELIRSLRRPPAERDETLQHPRCVFQIVKRHFSRYTPEMVERITGCPRDTFLRVAETVLENSGRDRTTAWVYAVGWTQHTYGPQMIGCCALLQLLLGNIGRPGGGIMALRGHASIQGSTDIPTLYHSIHGYMPAPSALKRHGTLREYLASEASATGYWANMPKFMVSYLKSMYGDAATPENDFGYDWHPKISGDHSHLPMFVAMAEGRVKGMICIGQNPATSLNASLERKGLRRLEWLVVKDNFITETAAFWYRAPEVQNGEVKPEEIETEVFFFPSAQVAETEGSFTNTQRMLQWHYQAALPPGDCRSDLWFTHQLAKRLKALYADSDLPRDQGFKNLVWDFDPDVPGPMEGEPDPEKILREINGYYTGHPERHLSSFAELKDDGSTTCASWIYCGVFPEPGKNLAKRREPDPPDVVGAHLNWGWAWPANRRVLYNRASADPRGRPWSDRKRWVWWGNGRWIGLDTPDFPLTKPPWARANPNGIGLDAHSGSHPFIMKPDGVGWLFNPIGLVDGPLPTHYEPAESPVRNALYGQQTSPVLKYWRRDDNLLAMVGDERFPYVITTYRLTEHYLAGAMSRWNPWLTQLMPELFIEISPELAQEKGIRNTDWVRVITPRGEIRAKALVTGRMRPFNLGGRIVHQVGMPWHWGWQGVVTGDVVNELTALVGDPNVSIHEGKAFVCNVERA
ncbi:Formate dehydrogenase, nitrate-inducible, major subunit [bacterium HR33]|nr:Formate dehydrogenase, nitrate-inducible, major subunit [bacterium HR33]